MHALFQTDDERGYFMMIILSREGCTINSDVRLIYLAQTLATICSI